MSVIEGIRVINCVPIQLALTSVVVKMDTI